MNKKLFLIPLFLPFALVLISSLISTNLIPAKSSLLGVYPALLIIYIISLFLAPLIGLSAFLATLLGQINISLFVVIFTFISSLCLISSIVFFILSLKTKKEAYYIALLVSLIAWEIMVFLANPTLKVTM